MRQLITRRGIIRSAAAASLLAAPSLILPSRAQSPIVGFPPGTFANRAAIDASGAAATTWDPASLSGGTTLDATHLIATCPSGSGFANTTSTRNSGKVYLEYTFGGSGAWSSNSWYCMLQDVGAGFPTGYVVASVNTWHVNNVGVAQSAVIPVIGDVQGIAIDITNKSIWSKTDNVPDWNGQPIGVANPATNIGGADFTAAVVTGNFNIGFNQFDGVGTPTVTLNAGASAFHFTPPAGFSAWL